MGKRGPMGLSVPELKLRGTFRADKHEKREKIPVADGVPVRPKYLKGEALNYWNRLVPKLLAMNLVKAVDTELIVAACESWAFYRKAAEAATESPLDQDTRAAFRSYHISFMDAVKRLGLSPLDRSRLTVEEPKEEETDPFDAFVRKRG